MVATFSVLGIALDSQTDIVDTSRDVADIDLKQQQEEFTMNAFTTGPNGTAVLSVNVHNLGQNPTEIFSLIVTDSQNATAGFPVDVYDIPADASFVMPRDTKNILATTTPQITLSLPILANETKVFTFKTISSLGNIAFDSVICDINGCADPVTPPGEGALSATLFLDGPTGVNTKTSTVIMFVTNTSEETVTDVQPINGFDADPNCLNFWEVDNSTVTVDDGINENITNCSVSPNVPQTLGKFANTIFKWDVTVGGDIGAEFEFCNSVTGDDGTAPLVTSVHPLNCALPLPLVNGAFDSLTVIDPNDCDGCGQGGEGGESIILIDDLLIRPTIFMVIPAPFGATLKTAQYTGLWGINLANPTNEPMDISKVTIVGYPPGGQSQDNVFSGKDDDCLQEDILPNTGPQPFGGWDCPRDNILMWQNFTDPLILPANSTRSFMVRVEPSGIKPGGEPANLDALIVQANVYSSFGSFGKAAYQSSMYLEPSPIVNVYLSDTIDSRTSFIGNRNDIPVNSTETFIVVMADLDNDSGTVINIDSRLIINVPREWTFVDFLSCDGYDAIADGDCDDPPIPTAIVHADGSSQIIGITTDEIGDGGAGGFDARSIEFRAIAPDVKAPRLYVMYILGDGIVTVPGGTDKTIGPLMEAVLNVDPLP